MRKLAWGVLLSFTVTSCGGGSTNVVPYSESVPQVYLTSPVQHLDAFNDTAPVALFGANAIQPLFAIPNIQTNLGAYNMTFWGVKDGAGSITQLNQASVVGPNTSVSIFFDTSDRPVLMRDDASGYSLALSYGAATTVTVTACDPSNAVIASSQFQMNTGTASDATAGGSCNLGPSTASVRHVATTVGSSAITNPSLAALTKFITSASYVAGLGFSIAAIMKFKSHKDNPTQIPISTPIALIFVAAALLFLPTILSTTGVTVFGSYAADAPVDGLGSYLQETTLTGVFPSPDPTP